MRVAFGILSALFMPLGTFGDMGSIPFDAKARILEPNQTAIIAHNGSEELLILTTDLQADRDTKVLEIMPLPSEPIVARADAEIFVKATELINAKLRQRGDEQGWGDRLAEATFGVDDASPAGRITFHERIGAHDISTVHVERPEGFVKWASELLAAQGVDNPTIPPELGKVVDEYLREGFSWFVFDLVSLSNRPVTKEAIQLRFKSDFLYYPMRITRTEQGGTTVRLLVLSPSLFQEEDFLGLPRFRINLLHLPVILSETELAGLSGEIYEMLGRPKGIRIRQWEIKGNLNSFADDVIVGDPMKFIKFLRRGSEGDL